MGRSECVILRQELNRHVGGQVWRRFMLTHAWHWHTLCPNAVAESFVPCKCEGVMCVVVCT